MIYFPKTKAQLTQEMAVAAGQTIAAEGQALVAATALGVFGVQPSSNNTSELFMGVAVSEQISPATFPKVEQTVISSGLTFALTYGSSYVSASISIYDNTSAQFLTGGGTDYSGPTSGVVTFVPGGGHCSVGDTVTIFYRYSPTLVQIEQLQGDAKPGGPAGAILGQVGVIKSGIVYTSEWDTTVNWLGTNPTLKTTTSGRFTTSAGTGTAINAVVISAPNANDPTGAFLGIEFYGI